MMELTDFLLARISEDEAVARAALAWLRADPADRWRADDGRLLDGVGDSLAGYMGDDVAPHAARWDPARVLAECESKRRIVERHKSTPLLDHYEFECTCGFRDHRVSQCRACGTTTYDEGEWERSYGPCPDLCLLAQPYASHPDYDPTWSAAEETGQ